MDYFDVSNIEWWMITSLYLSIASFSHLLKSLEEDRHYTWYLKDKYGD